MLSHDWVPEGCMSLHSQNRRGYETTNVRFGLHARLFVARLPSLLFRLVARWSDVSFGELTEDMLRTIDDFQNLVSDHPHSFINACHPVVDTRHQI